MKKTHETTTAKRPFLDTNTPKQPRPTKEDAHDFIFRSRFGGSSPETVDLFYKKRQAVEYLTLGYSIFPLVPGDKRPGVKWEKFQTRHIEKDEWREWWGEHPDSNIAIVTGELSNVDVIDVDSEEGRKELENQLPAGFKTQIVKTPRGYHYFFRHTDGVRNKAQFIKDCDVRGGGGYVVAPPSTVKGHKYRWLPGHTPEDALLQEIPEPLLGKILEGSKKAKEKKKPVDPIRVLEGIPEGERDNTLFKYACRLRSQGLKKKEALLLVLQAAENCVPPFPEDEAKAKVESAWGYDSSISKETWFEILNDRYAVIKAGGKVTVMEEVIDETFDSPRPNITLFKSKEDFFTLYSNKRVSDGKKEISIAKYWIEHPERRTYEGVVFEPEKQISGKYNLWKGFGVEPSQGDWSLMREHIFENICTKNDEWFSYLMDWLAYIVQKPGGERPGVSIVLRGKQGTGKSFFASTYGELFGSHYLHITNQAHFTGKFNSHQRNCILGFIDEAFWSGDRPAVGVVKSIITESHIISEQKFQDALMIKNHMNLIFSSNQDWIIPAGLEERRFFVLDVSARHMQDTKYFGPIFRQMRDENGKEAMLYDLLRREVKVDLRHPLHTEALLDQKLLSMDTFQQWWLRCLTDGQFPRTGEWEEPIETKEMYKDYLDYTKDLRDNHPMPDNTFGRKLRRTYNATISHPTIGGSQHRCYRLPPLGECRSRWERDINYRMAWDRPGDVHEVLEKLRRKRESVEY